MQSPDLHVTLVESDLRKATFLRQAAQELGLDVDCAATARIESLPSVKRADVHVGARAGASCRTLLTLRSEAHLKPGRRRDVSQRARGIAEEIAEARTVWAFRR